MNAPSASRTVAAAARLQRLRDETAAKMSRFVGKRAHLEVKAGSTFIRVEVEILDAKWKFGRVDLKFRPVAGTGEGWASLEKLTLIK